MKFSMFILFFFIVALLSGQSNQFSEILQKYHTEKQFSGTLLVATHGNIDFIGSVGKADREKGTVLKDTSNYRIASLSKVFTAILIMKLVEEGKVQLNRTIKDYIPNYKGAGKDSVTIHHLLTYASGIENQLDELGMAPYQSFKTLDEFIDTFCSGDLVFNPGEKSSYGNTEYILLHKIIENVSQLSYDAYLEKIILKPIGIKNTQMVTRKNIKYVLPSYIYNEELNDFEEDVFYFPEMYFGAGAMYATIEDLLKFDVALFSNQLLANETTNTLLKIHPELGYTAYGLWGSTGWGNFSEPFYYRTGAILGSNANWIHTMEKGKTIIVLSNTNSTNLYELSEKLFLASLPKE